MSLTDTQSCAVPLSLAADVVCVLVFCAVGRRSHAEGVTLAGLTQTAWPFLAGTAAGWLLARAWRRPAAPVPTGVIVWAGTLVIGMLLRTVSNQGITPSFVVVAALVTALLLLGWRTAVVAFRRLG